ncbi:hypothetical protein ACRN9V_12725, partial [Shewanella baltica]|uniref:hypothetical protein n=1 Tax=Shewanella baltica TaxID=62322 RepID=UPI003D79D053
GCIASSWLFYSEVLTRLMGKLIGDADQICGYGFSSTYLGNKAGSTIYFILIRSISIRIINVEI